MFRSIVYVAFSKFSSLVCESSSLIGSQSHGFVFLEYSIFANISSSNTLQTTSSIDSENFSTLISSCSFLSVCNVVDGGIAPSLNNPLSSLSVSNTSFIGCCRTRNVECTETADNKLKPGRQNTTANGANSFIWCEWDGSKTTGTENSYADGASSGGAICMYSQTSASVSVSHCVFNGCIAYSRGGGIMCYNIKSVEVVNNSFNACTAQNFYGGGLYVYLISTCVRISGCEFQNCKASAEGGGLRLDNFQVLGSGCIPTENGGGESACVFDCNATSCSLTNNWGGGMFCRGVPEQFKMRSVQFISCNALTRGDNPFYECYATNTDNQRVCYVYNYASTSVWTFQHTEKKLWLKRGILNRFVAVNGGDKEEFCGVNESHACRTIGIAVSKSLMQMIFSIILMEGKHESEGTTISIGEKKVSILGRGKTVSVIGTNSLSSSSIALFSISSGQLGGTCGDRPQRSKESIADCVGGKGGGIYVRLKGNGKVVVSGTSVIDGNKAENNEGRGGGMFVLMESGGCELTIGQNVEFSKVNENVAEYGKDVFVDCGSGVFLESKVNTSSFAFFDTRIIPSDVFQLSGSENGEESEVIPLFVYLCLMGVKVIVDGSGGNGKDHNHCGFEGFGCLTVDYCANSRMSSTVNEIEVVSSSSIIKEIAGPLFGVKISAGIASSEGERMRVNVSDGGSATQDWIVGCSSSLTMSRLSFVVKGQLNSRRSAFIHSTSTLSMTNCSVSFESEALTNGKIGYNVINIEGGNLIVDGFVMESSVTMNRKSPITMTSGAQLEILNTRVSGVEMAGGIGGGCLNVGMKEGGDIILEESNISSTCSGGSGMKGGGMMISVGSGGTLRVKGVKLSGCAVPSEDIENGGRGMGGGMFAELADQMGRFSLESMAFCECNAWKGKNMFVSGWDLSEIVNKEHLKWEMISEELGSLDKLCGWERKTTGGNGYVIPLVMYLWDNWVGMGLFRKRQEETSVDVGIQKHHAHQLII
ncbi:uncharacterized protein MONOS_6456 [Monocercomonoides exilis]|uniref:uncharacterized protein n=1 Tax=Monocercomonoides exilis TaxID=2049356 RepID=UPI003559E0B4|nr:hypothetical protein MONOS_6456 [Monocercomonoides exilis]|eukprot:MONOS_6456.1-p1 / transcript=MONOS_6456.1 / gene=MONOS_6456 / organism=Monocercomonoides_exilis_PA203 / gene_product=unspecified product / transcript_product=unspecified product / location=Mono_scaffold00203:47132-50498(+) / protein_length=987 / sequence_SO=supercontig / SO=protein_coding / is_pseudo=false